MTSGDEKQPQPSNTKFDRAVRRFKAQQLKIAQSSQLPKNEHRLGYCDCGRVKPLSKSACYVCADAMRVISKKYRENYADNANMFEIYRSPPKILVQIIPHPTRTDPLAKNGNGEIQNLFFDDIVKLYEECQ
jgi:hypothetical protein